jgi:hypothetical protein
VSVDVPVSTSSNYVVQRNYFAEGVATAVAWLYVVLILFSCFWTGSSVWIYPSQVLQLLFMTYYTNLVFPPTLGNVLQKLQPVTLGFLPNPFSRVIPEAVARENIPANIKVANEDFLFLRVCGYVYFCALFIGLSMVLVKMLTLPEINRLKPLRNWLRKFLSRKFKTAYQVEAAALIIANVTFFALFQLRDLTVYQPIVGFSIFSAVVFGAFFLILPPLLLGLTFRTVEEYPKLFASLRQSKEYFLTK